MDVLENWAVYACKQALQQCTQLPIAELESGLTLQIPCGIDESSVACTNALSVVRGISAYTGEALPGQYEIVRNVQVQQMHNVCYATSGLDSYTISDAPVLIDETDLKYIEFYIQLPANNNEIHPVKYRYSVPDDVLFGCPDMAIEYLVNAFREQGIADITENDFDYRQQHDGSYLVVLANHVDPRVSHDTLSQSSKFLALEIFSKAANFPISGYFKISKRAACVSSLGAVFEITSEMVPVANGIYDAFKINSLIQKHRDETKYVANCYDIHQLQKCYAQITPHEAVLYLNLTATQSTSLAYNNLSDNLIRRLPAEKIVDLCNLLTPEMLEEFSKSPELLTQIATKLNVSELEKQPITSLRL